MPLIRGHHSFDDHFAQIPNAWLRDTRLSLKAIGLLAQIMSHTPGWNMSIRALARANGAGQDTIKTAIMELEKHGYLQRSEKQKQNADGTFADYDFVTCDPFQNPVTVKPRHGEMGHIEEQEPIEELNKIKKEKKPGVAKATYLSDDWQPTEKTLSSMREHFPWVDLKLQTHAFVDYWQAATKNAMKRDWEAAYRNWVRKNAEWQKPTDTPRTRNKIRAED